MVSNPLVDGPQWAQGCFKCSFGLINAAPIPPAKTVADFRLAQFRTGDLEFCGCPAGVAYQRLLSDRANPMPTLVDAYDATLPDERIPPRLSVYSFAGFRGRYRKIPGRKAAIDAISALYKGTAEKPGLLLYGPPGVGKTGILTPYYKYRLEQGETGIWISYPSLLSLFRNLDYSDLEKRKRRFQGTNNLFIDDLGNPAADRAATDYARALLFEIVDHRVNHHRPMFITTNLELNTLSDQFHARLARRLDVICATIPMEE